MAVSNQLRSTNKVVVAEGMPPAVSPQEETAAPTSGLNRKGISSSIALKGKKITNLSLKTVSNF